MSNCKHFAYWCCFETHIERDFDLHNNSPAKLYSLHCHLYANGEGVLIPASLFAQLSVENCREIKGCRPHRGFPVTHCAAVLRQATLNFLCVQLYMFNKSKRPTVMDTPIPNNMKFQIASRFSSTQLKQLPSVTTHKIQVNRYN